MERLTVVRPPAGAGVEWLRRGWGLFKPWPIPWMGMTALAFLVIVGVTMLPYVGGPLVELLSPALAAGYMLAARAADRGEPVTFMHLGEGFTRNLPALLVIGGVYLVGGVLVAQVMILVGGVSLHDMMRLAQESAQVTPEQAQAMLDHTMPALLLGLVLYVPLLMATWFAPALVVFRGFSPVNALWWSLWTCFANWRPVALYGLAMGGIAMLALLIPFGLGLLVLLPWAMTSTYAAYGQLFISRAESQ